MRVRLHSRGRPAGARRARRGLAAGLLLTTVMTAAEPLTLAALTADADLTPSRFARHFSDFDFEFHPQVAPADEFLAQRKGDCDDYAVLAHHVLRARGFTTRLIHVRLVGQVAHAVCYVKEADAYLDYNDRAYFFKLTRSKGRLRDVANKVADSLEANWTSVSEFSYSYETDAKKVLRTVVKTEAPEKDPDHDE